MANHEKTKRHTGKQPQQSAKSVKLARTSAPTEPVKSSAWSFSLAAIAPWNFASGFAMGLAGVVLASRAKRRKSSRQQNAFSEDESRIDDDRIVADVMTEFPTMCTAETTLPEIAKRMVDEDCGAIPIVEEMGSRRAIGMITDRDIVVRTLAKGRNPMGVKARDCMTAVTVTIPDSAPMSACVDLMRERQVRRMLVVDDRGQCVGIVAQADVALEMLPTQTQELVGEVSVGMGSTIGPVAA